MDEELAEFCRREHPRLVAALDFVCGSLPLAEDLAQETFARVCKDWQRIRAMDSPIGYTHRIGLNLARSSFRRRALERRVGYRLAREDSWHDPDAAGAVAVRAALQGLREQQRRVLVLRYFLGYSVMEAAEVLDMPVGSVKTHAARGLAALRDQLGANVTTEDMYA
ncbi:MAG TPA: sigma-70 family RNA polymerase sigma factor [Mycobacteriales bacterium]|nr:sigma-70 family RNA polymerase sigma factor [Mycobacteriales bacterium]